MLKGKRIVMIGPVYPYKTGLSYYVTLLYRQLKLHNKVDLISYKMQYPKFLYKKEQKDYSDEVLKVEEAKFLLHSANPFNWYSTAKYINRENPDIVIFQWLHPYFAPCYYLLIKLLKCRMIVYICHNALPHERFPLDKWLTRIALKNAQGFVTHSVSDGEDLKKILHAPHIKVAVHPAYNFFRIQDMSKIDAREKLGLGAEDNVLLFFGLVREYKGLVHLLRALPQIDRGLNIKLLIAGDFAGERERYEAEMERLQIRNCIQIYDGHIPIAEVEKFFAACDLVVLPYESATQSGVIQVAYGFDKPVLATRVGGLPDVVFHMETGYIVEPQNPVEIAKAIDDFYHNNRSDSFISGIEREKYRYSWEKMDQTISDLVEEIEQYRNAE